MIFCDGQFGRIGPDYTKFEVLISQNKSILEEGEDLIVKAGIGSFYNLGDPYFKIGGEIVESEHGYTYYKIKTKNKLGLYKVPITIEYTDVNNKRLSITDVIEYKVKKK